MARVDQLWRYPVKSMLGEQVERAVVGPSGLLGDRAFAVVAVDDGTVASAKVPRSWSGLLGFRATYTAEPEPGAPLPPADVLFPDGSTLRTDDARIHAALSGVLGREVRISADPVAGAQFEEVWPQVEGLAPQRFIEATTVGREAGGEARSRIGLGMLVGEPSFFDLATLHLLTTGTLARLREHAPDATFDVRRYRPNVLVDTGDERGSAEADGFVEDDWVGRTVTAGEVGMAVAMLTMRCVMTTLAQEELPEDPDTLRAIARHHRRAIPEMGTWACAGVYAGTAAPGTIAVGDPVSVA